MTCDIVHSVDIQTTPDRYPLNFSGQEKPNIWLKLFCADREGYPCEKEGSLSCHVTPSQEAAN
jgi:hypothetical protein